MGVLYLIIGFVGGVAISIAGYYDPKISESERTFMLLSFIWVPLLYALMGLVFGYVFALLYNVIAKKIGPIEIELHD